MKKENKEKTLIEKLRAETEQLRTSKEDAVADIVNSFSVFARDRLESFLVQVIDTDAKMKGSYELFFEFWEHQDGCSATHFYISGWTWKNEEVDENSLEQDYYKGFKLKDIHKDVLRECVDTLEKRLKDMGFKTIVEQEKTRLGCNKGKITIRW